MRQNRRRNQNRWNLCPSRLEQRFRRLSTYERHICGIALRSRFASLPVVLSRSVHWLLGGAAGGNRTRVSCLEGRGFTIKLQPPDGHESYPKYANLLLLAGLVYDQPRPRRCFVRNHVKQLRGVRDLVEINLLDRIGGLVVIRMEPAE